MTDVVVIKSRIIDIKMMMRVLQEEVSSQWQILQHLKNKRTKGVGNEGKDSWNYFWSKTLCGTIESQKLSKYKETKDTKKASQIQRNKNKIKNLLKMKRQR